jgi:hypothetical protein
LAIFMVFGLAAATRPAAALDVSSTRDNDANAVIQGGCLTISECQQKFTNDSSVANIFSCFHINTADMNNMTGHAVVGQVTDKNTVIVNGKTVATNAMTAGRKDYAGSTKSTCGNFPFFMRPPSVSFASSPLTAFVMMDSNNQFDFAILTSCGNPVIATPVKVKTTAPAAPTQTQQQQQQQTVIVNNTQPATTQQQQSQPAAPTQTQTQTSPAPSKSLPNTGPGAVAGFSFVAGGLSALGHLFYQRYLRRI